MNLKKKKSPGNKAIPNNSLYLQRHTFVFHSSVFGLCSGLFGFPFRPDFFALTLIGVERVSILCLGSELKPQMPPNRGGATPRLSLSV